MGTCQFAMLLHTAMWLSTSAPFPLTDVRPGIYASGQDGGCMSDNLAPATPRDDTENMSFLQLGKARGCAPNAAIWGRAGRGIGGIAIEGALCLRRRRPESLRSCHICAIPSLDTNVACLLQHPGSRCRSSEGPLTSSDRQSAPFLPSVQTAGYYGTENLAGKTNRPCCTGHDDAACLMPVLRHSFAAQPTALQRLRSGSQVTSGPPEALCGLGTAS